MECLVTKLPEADAGRGGVAIAESLIESLALELNDCISIRAPDGTYAYARVRPKDTGGDGTPTIALGPYLLAKLGIEVGETVTIEPITLPAAESATLRIPEVHWFQGSGTLDALHTRLLNRPIMDDRPAMVALGIDGFDAEQHIPVRPMGLEPTGPAIVTKETQLEIDQDAYFWSPSDEDTDLDIDFDDIGGLSRELELIREMVELPMEYPELFDRLEVEPPSGVLLHGPPGTGKTLIARAVCGQIDATFLHIDGPEIVDPHRGMEEAALRETFQQARENAPAVIFLDEVDAIAASREGDTQHRDDQLVAQLLTLMDGLESNENVVVIGATNRADAIDPALRRGGRFDREIEIGVPGESDRLEILEIHAEGMPLADDVDLEDYAARTYGFVGADLKTLVTEAGMNAVDRVRPTVERTDPPLPSSMLEEITITVEDVDQALTSVEPSAMREFAVEVPIVSWDDVGGLEEVKRRLRETVQWPLEFGSAYRTLDVEPPSGLLLYGPPGTGKTLLAKAAANEMNANFVSVNGPELMNALVGGAEENVRELFKKARSNAPCLVLFDEIDAIAVQRSGGSNDSGVTDRVVSQLLTELDGIDTLENVFVIATTNRKDIIDDALLRPGRLDYQLEVPNPDEEARREIFAVHTENKPLADSVDLDDLAGKTAGLSGAEVEALCREASLTALREVAAEVDLEAVEKTTKNVSLYPYHFEQALESLEADDEAGVNHRIAK